MMIIAMQVPNGVVEATSVSGFEPQANTCLTAKANVGVIGLDQYKHVVSVLEMKLQTAVDALKTWYAYHYYPYSYHLS